MAIAIPVIMGHLGKMVVQQKMDTKNLTGVLGDHAKMALQSSPEAASIAQQLPAAQESAGGISGILKKTLNI